MSKNPPAALVKAKPVTTKALAKVAAPESPGIIVKLIELASNPAVDIAKINALIDTNERIMAITAKQAFDRDFAAMQSELPIVTKAGLAKVAHRDGQGSHEIQYARFSDIRRAVDPVLSRHGFALRFRNRMADGLLTITGILSHQQGHREEDEFTTGPENSGSKNTLQAWGSARQYGMRYTANALLGLASEADDDDGEEAAPRPKASPPPRQSATAGPDAEHAVGVRRARDLRQAAEAPVGDHQEGRPLGREREGLAAQGLQDRLDVEDSPDRLRDDLQHG